MAIGSHLKPQIMTDIYLPSSQDIPIKPNTDLNMDTEDVVQQEQQQHANFDLASGAVADGVKKII